MQPFTIAPWTEPQVCFRVDTFVVPETARAELEATMRRNMDFIRTLPGFRGHVAFEKSAGPSTFDLVTVAAWQDRAALERAGAAVRAHYREVGVDLPALLARWGVKMERGDFTAPARLQ
jgi:heme-degrading monooxygenase HmoA